jgi:Zn finger protein HypA/HybF involved in hydrogenase expression
MHEVGIACSVLEAVRKEVAMRPGYRAVTVGLRIGELAGVDAESLRFGFGALVRDSDLEPLDLAVESALADELDIAWIELEET